MHQFCRPLSSWLAMASGVWCIGLGAYFAFLRPGMLPEDSRYIGMAQQALLAGAPGLTAWLAKVFTVLGGFMAGAGVLTFHLAWQGLPVRARGSMTVLTLSGALTVGTMSAVNFALGSDFRWVLVLPVLLWVALLATYVRERRRNSHYF